MLRFSDRASTLMRLWWGQQFWKFKVRRRRCPDGVYDTFRLSGHDSALGPGNQQACVFGGQADCHRSGLELTFDRVEVSGQRLEVLHRRRRGEAHQYQRGTGEGLFHICLKFGLTSIRQRH